MKKRVFTLLLAAGLLAVAALTALTYPCAGPDPDGLRAARHAARSCPSPSTCPPGATLDDIQLPGPWSPRRPRPRPRSRPRPPSRARQSRLPRPPPRPPRAAATSPSSGGGSEQERSSSGERVQDKSGKSRDLTGDVKARAKDEISKAKRHGRRSPLRNADGTPTPSQPRLHRRAPRPVDRHRRAQLHHPQVPRAAVPAARSTRPPGIQYGVRWEVLAAINEIETDYGRNLNVSSAGALGWMQFMPSTWKMYGVDANKDGRKDPYNPVDAIFAAARYLKAAGYEQDVRRAIFAYNHADWYVDSVLLRARLIAGVPGRPDRLAHRAHRGPLPRLRTRALRGRPRRAAAAQEGQAAARTPPTSSSRATRAAASTSSPRRARRSWP